MAVFNTDKVADDYVVSTPFLNKEPGLLDTVNKCFPKVWDIYKLMRSCDWTEDDFNYTDNIEDFTNGPTQVSDIMLKTLMWQWESDSVASRAPTIIIAPFNPATEIWAAEQRITDNEQCLTRHHEVYVAGKGWVSIADVVIGDSTLNFDPKTKEIRFSKVLNKIQKANTGKMFFISNKTGTIKQHVTEDHRMCVYRSRGKEWVHSPTAANDFIPHTLCRLAVSGIKVDGDKNHLTFKDRLWIAFQADGSHDEKYTGARTGFWPMRFSFKKQRKIEALRSILSNIEYQYKEWNDDRGYTCFSIQIPVSDVRGGGKQFSWVKIHEVSHEWCEEFIYELKNWDATFGSSGKRHIAIYTSTNKECIDAVALISHLAGFRALVKLQKDDRPNRKPCWQINISQFDNVNCGGIKKQVDENFNDDVFCITVAEDAFLTRYEDTITVSHNCHGNTYSEIVRTGMPNSNEVIGQLLETTEVIRRLGLVSQTLDKVMAYSRKIAYEQKYDRFEAYEHLLLFYYAMLILERIQFIASFAITFSICDSGLFQSIGQAVKLICRDELQVHCEYRKEVLREILKTEEGKAAYTKLRPLMCEMLDEVIDNELSWTEWLFDGRSIVGTNASIVKKFVLYSARDVALFLDLESKHRFVKENPMPHLIKWFDIDYSQSAPQENDVPNYKLGTVSNDDDGEEFDL